jgi:hypothetical protein
MPLAFSFDFLNFVHLVCVCVCVCVFFTDNTHARNSHVIPLKPSGIYMYDLLQQSLDLSLHFAHKVYL